MAPRVQPHFDEKEIAAFFDRLGDPADLQLNPEAQDIYGDIRTTLRVPFLGLPFRVLATDTTLLRGLWGGLRGFLATRYVEREADRLRTHALFTVPHPDLGAEHRAQARLHGVDERTFALIARTHETIHYVLPKLILAAAAGAMALRGDPLPAGREGRSEELQPLVAGVAPSAVQPQPLEIGALTPPLRRQLESLRELHGHPLIHGYFLVLARWPAYLERVTADLRLVVGSPRYRQASSTLATLAEVAVRSYPGALTMSVDCERIGRPEAAALLAYLHERLLPDLLLDAAFLRCLLEGERRARRNALSLTEV